MRQRDPRKLLPENRPLPARVKLVHVPEQGYAPDGSVSTRQEAEIKVPSKVLDALWKPEHLEDLARTYWAWLTKISLGLIRVRYGADCREIVFIGRPFVLIRFHPPEYETSRTRGAVTWRIERGLLVAPSGRNKGYLGVAVERPPEETGDEVTVKVTSEVAHFLPALSFPGSSIFNKFGRWLYQFTQLRIHVIVTHGFLRSLGNLRLERSKVGRFRLREPTLLEAAEEEAREAVAG
ncbi:MAG: hypothetical protein ACJ76Z_16935 [Thermoleophilaceae bacterium]